MRTRHRVPSVFNISMVDVLCCALGCVILLWLLNLREAKQKSEQAGRADERVASLQRELDDARGRLADLEGKYTSLQGDLSEAERQAAAVRRRLEDAQAEARDVAGRLKQAQGDRDDVAARAARLDKDLKALRAEKKAADDRLARRAREYADLEKKLTAASDRVAALEGQVRDRDTDARAAGRRMDSLTAKLKEADARARQLDEEVKGYRSKYADEAATTKALEKEVAKRGRELDEARQSIVGLEGDKKRLRAEADRVRLAADNRFAGITLTGRRVVFLVDMSGSMELVDEKTEAPEKWTGVRETLAKVMRSLPDLEKFQVILFSNKTSFLLGDDGWIDYDRNSAARVTEALAKVKPLGDTDMYSAFEAAFRFRAQGLDTIYLFSDGLPNIGAGLTAEEARTLKETEQSDILGRYVRRKLKTDWNRDVRGRPRVRINAVGFFYESPDVGAFLWALTRENDGSFVGMSKP
jgi:predicted  nucleic acid-binding Zn-ribbon protein